MTTQDHMRMQNVAHIHAKSVIPVNWARAQKKSKNYAQKKNGRIKIKRRENNNILSRV